MGRALTTEAEMAKRHADWANFMLIKCMWGVGDLCDKE